MSAGQAPKGALPPPDPMEVRAPREFLSPIQLGDSFPPDPRRNLRIADGVVIDLRDCEAIGLEALLWIVVYEMLAKARGIPTRLLVPEDDKVESYLRSAGLFSVAKSSPEGSAGEKNATMHDEEIVLPLTRVQSEGDVNRLANRAYTELMDERLGRPKIQRTISEAFAELAMNAVEHASSPIGAFGLLQMTGNQQFAFGIADGGVGIRATLSQKPNIGGDIREDEEAILAALRERVSGTGDPTRGIGLYGIAEEMRKPGSSLVIHSGTGRIQIANGDEMATRETLFPGTLTYGAIRS